MTDDQRTLRERIAELEAKVEHDEDNLEGLQGALVRANQEAAMLRCCANCETREEEHDYSDWWYFCPLIEVNDDPRQNRLYDQKVDPDDPCLFTPSCWTKRGEK